MIISIFITAMASLLAFFGNLIPDASILPTGFTTALDNIFAFAIKANKIFPLDTAFSIILTGITLEVTMFSIKLLNLFYNKLRGSG